MSGAIRAKFTEKLQEFQEIVSKYPFKEYQKRFTNVDTSKEIDVIIKYARLNMSALYHSLSKNLIPCKIEDYLDAGYKEYVRLLNGSTEFPGEEWVRARIWRAYPSFVRDVFLYLVLVSRLEEIDSRKISVLRTPKLDSEGKFDLFLLTKANDEIFMSAVENVTSTKNSRDYLKIKHDERPGVGANIKVPTVTIFSSSKNSIGGCWTFSDSDIDNLMAFPFKPETQTLPLSAFGASKLGKGNGIKLPLIKLISDALEEWQAAAGSEETYMSMAEYLDRV